MANYGFIIDNRRCIGCHACTVACKAEHETPLGVNRTWVKYIEKGQFPDSRRLFSVMRCNHCDAAPCVEICPVTALYRRDDGIVDFDNRRCIGCKACMQACPYDALYIDPETHTAAKCNYCAHRVDRGLEPACVNVCPTQAIISGDLDDPDSNISLTRSREVVTARKTEKGTLPRLFYIDGDEASLEPGLTESIHATMWGSQTGGVGHFAPREAAEPNAVPAGEHPLTRLRKLLDLGDPGDGVLVPDESNSEQRRQAEHVRSELARRSYDAPDKGTLWGWPVAAYVWTKAIAAGAGLIGSAGLIAGVANIGHMVVAVIAGLLFLGLTGALLVLDLDQPKRFIYVLLRPQWRSWLVRGAYIITVYAALLVGWCLAMMMGAPGLGRIILYLLIPASGLTALYTAFLFAQAKGRDFWQSPLLGVHMICHSVIAGAAFFAVWLPLTRLESWHQFVSTSLAVALVSKLLIDWLELTTTHSTADAKRAVQLIRRGKYTRLYWTYVIALGCVVPLAILALTMIWLVPLAGLAALSGLYVAEHIWIRAPQQIPLS